MTLRDLPDEMMNEVLSFLPPRDLARATMSSKTFGKRIFHVSSREETSTSMNYIFVKRDELCFTPSRKISFAETAACRALRSIWSKPEYTEHKREILNLSNWGPRSSLPFTLRHIYYIGRTWTSAYHEFLKLTKDDDFTNRVNKRRRLM